MTTQNAFAQQLTTDYRANHERISQLVRPMDPEQLVRRPGPGRWSVAEVLEHLLLMDTLFMKAVEPHLRRAVADATAGTREWKPTFIGRQIAAALERPKRLRAPKVGRPLTPRPGVAEAFLITDSRAIDQVSETMMLDWNRVRLRPPVVPWLPLKLNLGDAFQVRRVHVARHLRQIERTIADVT